MQDSEKIQHRAHHCRVMALAAACHSNSECEVRSTTSQGLSRTLCHTVGFLTDFTDGAGTP